MKEINSFSKENIHRRLSRLRNRYIKVKGEIAMTTKTTKNQSFSEIIKGDTPVLVDFYADWCGPCKMMNPILKKLKNRMGDRINIIKIDAEKNADAAIRYQVRGVPTLILFHKGRILWQQSGVVREQQLQSIIESKISGAN
jgi:thioredoxin 1